MRVLFLTILISLFAWSACGDFVPDIETYDPDYDPEISVFAVISPDESYEFVVVERTRKLEEYDYWDKKIDTIIKDAIVKIASDKDTVQFAFYQREQYDNEYYHSSNYYDRGIYLDRASAFRAVAGETYTLIVETSDGRVVTGTAQVPEKPQITSPLSYASIQKTSVRAEEIRWHHDDKAAGYQLFYIVEERHYDSYDGSYYAAYRQNMLYDYTVTSPPATLEQLDSYYLEDYDNTWISFSDTATIKVMAMERNYYDYIRLSTGLAELSGINFNTLEGGIGVFGAVSTDSVNIVLK